MFSFKKKGQALHTNKLGMSLSLGTVKGYLWQTYQLPIFQDSNDINNYLFKPFYTLNNIPPPPPNCIFIFYNEIMDNNIFQIKSK